MVPSAGSRICAPPVAGGVRSSVLPLNIRRPCGKATIGSSVASKLAIWLTEKLPEKQRGTGFSQVVDIHVEQWYVFEGAVDWVLKVHLWSPVDTLVIFN
jgi:hypothetical protein